MEYKDATDVIAGARGLLDRLERRIVKSRLSRVFWHSVNVKWYTPPILTGISWELDYPHRRSRTLVLRYWWGKSLVLGFWGKKHYDEDEALLQATIYGRDRTSGEYLGWDEQSYSEGEFAGDSGPVLSGRPGLRVRATTDARADD